MISVITSAGPVVFARAAEKPDATEGVVRRSAEQATRAMASAAVRAARIV
jgi:hypothetical protein